MSDPYRIDQTPTGGDGYERVYRPVSSPGAAGKTGGSVSTLLWIVVAIGAGLNTACSVAGQDVLGGLFGGLAGAGLIALLVRYLNRRKR
ncbi:hypothetical protein [Flexivirga alba]|uniref:LPXTG cell wall anchor domain-containing protein n=1 Tax=Flexivirga alba TaxID=702742 RepID=A0ABW2AJD0_9MICO